MGKLINYIFLFTFIALAMGCSKKPDQGSSESSLAAPAAPTDLVFVVDSESSVTLSWTDVATSELIYEIESCLGAACEEFASVTGSPLKKDSSTMVISGLASLSTYRFRVRAVSSGGVSLWLTTDDVVTDPAAIQTPGSLAISDKTDVSLKLSWNDNATNEQNYAIDACVGAACTNFTAVAGSPFAANSESAEITGLTPSTIYRFRVYGTNGGANSAYLISSNVTMPPAAPTVMLSGAVTSSSIDFSWTDNGSDDTGYEVEKCSGSGCTIFTAVSSSPLATNSTSHSESGLTENAIYRFRVRAKSANGTSNYLLGPYAATLLAAPTGLAVTSLSDTSVRVSWTDNSSAETGYQVERCAGAGCTNFAAIAGSPFAASSVSATNTGLTHSSTYRYRVRATSASLNSSYLTSADVVTGPMAPTAFTLGAVTYNSVSFSWTDNAANETGYQVDRCTGTACTSFANIANALPANTTGYTDHTPVGGTVYNYRVRAMSAAGTSAGLVSPNVTTLATPVPALSCTSPNHTIIDYGIKNAGAVATSARGLYTDVGYIPSGVSSATSAVTGQANGNIVMKSPNLGAAYIDTGAQAIKYSYWKDGVFKTEVVAGDAVANATYVKLVYLSNAPNAGKPLIFWTNGAANAGQIMMAARNTASLATAGTWTVQAIDVAGGATNRALQVSVNPVDQVALAYQSTTTPSIRFIYCGSSCQNPANYNAMTAGARVDTASTATQSKMGLAWCQHSQGNYTPGVVYGVSATTFTYATCSTFAGTPANCLAAGGWTRSTTPVTVGAGSGLVSDLYMDPSILKDTPKIVLKDNTAGGMKTYRLPTCDTFAVGSAYTGPGASMAGSTVANTANSYLKILKHPDYVTPANERYYIVANDGITDMRWTQSNSSDFAGAWTSTATATSSIHFNAALLGTAATTTMGADLNSATDQIVTGYGTNIAANFNVTLGVVDGYLGSSPSAATNTYLQMPIESNGNIQLNATQYNNVAIAATSTNRPGVAWVDFSSGVFTTGRLKYSLRTSATASGSSWIPVLVPGAAGVGTPGPLYPSLAFDNNDKPWIGYWDQTLLRFVLATNSESDGSGLWTSYLFPLAGAVNFGAPVAQPAANSTAVVMYKSGGVTYPVMIVINNSSVITKNVRSAMFTPSTGKWSSVSTIDGALLVGGAANLTADADATGKIVVAYQNLGAGAIRIKYSASTDGGATWPTNAAAPASVSNVNQGEGAIIKINPATGLPAVSYYDRANNRLYYANCTANCTGASAPTFDGTSTPVLNGIGISGLSGAGNSNLLEASLTFSQGGDAYVLYNSGSLDFGSIRFIDNIGGTMPSALPTTVVAGKNGTYNAAATAAINGGIPWAQQSVRLQNGALATAYISPGNWLAITTCGD